MNPKFWSNRVIYGYLIQNRMINIDQPRACGSNLLTPKTIVGLNDEHFQFGGSIKGFFLSDWIVLMFRAVFDGNGRMVLCIPRRSPGVVILVISCERGIPTLADLAADLRRDDRFWSWLRPVFTSEIRPPLSGSIRQPEKKLLLGCAWDVAMETRERSFELSASSMAGGSCRSILHVSYLNYSMLLWPFVLSDSLFANTSQISQQKRTRIAAVNLSTITW